MITLKEEITGDEEKNIKIYKNAKHIFERGGLVAFPTETVYGLGADALNPEACKRIYKAKGRPSDNPLIVHTASLKKAEEIAVFDERARLLADCFWPGPLTLVLKRKDCVPDAVTGGLDTVAVRVPSHPTARHLLVACDMFIAAPSANLSGQPSPTLSSHVIKDLDGRADLIIIDDSVNVGIESTILDMSLDKPVVLRPGVITPEQIGAVLGEEITFATESLTDGGPKAPGMKYRHYAPKAELLLVTGANEEKISFIVKSAGEAASSGKKVFILAADENAGKYHDGEVVNMGSSASQAASRLFKSLRYCDEKGADVIFAEGCEETGIGAALMNRLKKAAGNNIISV